MGGETARPHIGKWAVEGTVKDGRVSYISHQVSSRPLEDVVLKIVVDTACYSSENMAENLKVTPGHRALILSFGMIKQITTN